MALFPPKQGGANGWLKSPILSEAMCLEHILSVVSLYDPHHIPWVCTETAVPWRIYSVAEPTGISSHPPLDAKRDSREDGTG